MSVPEPPSLPQTLVQSAWLGSDLTLMVCGPVCWGCCARGRRSGRRSGRGRRGGLALRLGEGRPGQQAAPEGEAAREGDERGALRARLAVGEEHQLLTPWKSREDEKRDAARDAHCRRGRAVGRLMRGRLGPAPHASCPARRLSTPLERPGGLLSPRMRRRHDTAAVPAPGTLLSEPRPDARCGPAQARRGAAARPARASVSGHIERASPPAGS